jgi:hypothetical protein
MASNDFISIHIFGLDRVQLITKSVNKTIDYSKLNKVQPLVDEIFSKKPNDNTSTSEFHLINILNQKFVDYIPKSDKPNGIGKSFRLDFKDIDLILILNLITEMYAKS